ncbi:MAG: protein tyrosine phosphatase family protein [Rubrobacteraceae bacterium]
MKDVREVAPGMTNAVQPMEDVATAGQPAAEHLERLAEAGYKTVIDLRAEKEDRGFDEARTVRDSGMEYENIPVTPDTLSGEKFDRFRELMGDPERRPALVHCSSANRVGALLIPYLILDEGKTREEALEVAARVGLQSEELKEAALEYAGEESP